MSESLYFQIVRRSGSEQHWRNAHKCQLGRLPVDPRHIKRLSTPEPFHSNVLCLLSVHNRGFIAVSGNEN
jgi:hypothetical protein